jgi:dolichol-phosphate mannosyltransferase
MTSWLPERPTSLAVVVPCYNEEDSLRPLFEALIPALDEATCGSWKIVCVDDGSIDATFDILTRQNLKDARVSAVRLSRNFGHQAALSVGLAYARGEYIGIIDCDLQDPVAVLLQLYRKSISEQLDVCYGIRAWRDAPLLLRVAYSAFYRIIHATSGQKWPRDAGDFCVMSARCQRALLALPEQSRMLRGLRCWVGFRQAGIAYQRPARLHGSSKYNLRRLVSLALQGFVSFSTVPLRLASFVGMATGLISILFGSAVLINRLFPHFTVLHYWVGASPGVATLLVFVSFALSILFMCVGVIGEYLIVLLEESKRRPSAIVSSVIGDISLQDRAYALIDVNGSGRARKASL